MENTPKKTPQVHIPAHFVQHRSVIESWFEQQWMHVTPPVYGSVDLRQSGFKLGPVDTNLFSAGFNNLHPDSYPVCHQALRSILHRYAPQATSFVLVPESHTRNPGYIDHLSTLLQIMVHAGFDTRIGWLGPEQPPVLHTTQGDTLVAHALVRDGDRLSVDGSTPDVVVLNNDLSSGVPPILKGLSQPILPGTQMGWNTRRKSTHCAYYQGIAHEFSERLDMDPWLIHPLFKNCGAIDFMKREGFDCLAHNTHVLLQAIQLKYDHYGIPHRPFVMVKSDSGTYGMSVMPVFDHQTLRTLNRKQRTQMASAKGGASVSSIILQEGIYNFESWPESTASSHIAEPVVYLIGQQVVGGFYRVNRFRGADENLNAKGMYFQPISGAHFQEGAAQTPLFYAYGVVARLALLAAAKEIRSGYPPCL